MALIPPIVSKKTWDFSPQSIPGCQLWLDAADSSSIFADIAGTTLATTTVQLWKDKSGNGYNATTSTTSPSISGTSLKFTASQYLSTSYTAAPTAETVFAVVTPTTLAASTYYNILGASASLGRHFGTYGTAPTISLNPSTNILSASIITNSTTILLEMTYGAASTPAIYENGNLQTGTPTTGTFSGAGTTRIGNSSGGFVGTINEIICYNSVLSQQQRQQVEGYLLRKWNLLTATLAPPLTHPYNSLVTKPFSRNFIPPDISGCQLWLDAMDASTITGSSVSAWRDKSGNGYDAIQPTSENQPTFSTNSLTFNSNQFLSTTYSAVPTSGETVFVVVTPTSLPASTYCSIVGTSSGLGRQFGTYGSYPDLSPGGVGTIVRGSLAMTLSTTILLVMTCSTTSGSILYNGTSQGQSGNQGNIQGSGITTIGGNNSNSFVGSINEIICYNSRFLTQQRQQVEGYLLRKWNLLTATTPAPLAIPYYKTISSSPTPFNPRITGLAGLWVDSLTSPINTSTSLGNIISSISPCILSGPVTINQTTSSSSSTIIQKIQLDKVTTAVTASSTTLGIFLPKRLVSGPLSGISGARVCNVSEDPALLGYIVNMSVNLSGYSISGNNITAVISAINSSSPFSITFSTAALSADTSSGIITPISVTATTYSTVTNPYSLGFTVGMQVSISGYLSSAIPPVAQNNGTFRIIAMNTGTSPYIMVATVSGTHVNQSVGTYGSINPTSISGTTYTTYVNPLIYGLFVGMPVTINGYSYENNGTFRINAIKTSTPYYIQVVPTSFQSNGNPITANGSINVPGNITTGTVTITSGVARYGLGVDLTIFGYSVGSTITVSGYSIAGNNGTFTITAISSVSPYYFEVNATTQITTNDIPYSWTASSTNSGTALAPAYALTFSIPSGISLTSNQNVRTGTVSGILTPSVTNFYIINLTSSTFTLMQYNSSGFPPSLVTTSTALSSGTVNLFTQNNLGYISLPGTNAFVECSIPLSIQNGIKVQFSGTTSYDNVAYTVSNINTNSNTNMSMFIINALNNLYFPNAPGFGDSNSVIKFITAQALATTNVTPIFSLTNFRTLNLDGTKSSIYGPNFGTEGLSGNVQYFLSYASFIISNTKPFPDTSSSNAGIGSSKFFFNSDGTFSLTDSYVSYLNAASSTTFLQYFPYTFNYGISSTYLHIAYTTINGLPALTFPASTSVGTSFAAGDLAYISLGRSTTLFVAIGTVYSIIDAVPSTNGKIITLCPFNGVPPTSYATIYGEYSIPSGATTAVSDTVINSLISGRTSVDTSLTISVNVSAVTVPIVGNAASLGLVGGSSVTISTVTTSSGSINGTWTLTSAVGSTITFTMATNIPSNGATITAGGSVVNPKAIVVGNLVWIKSLGYPSTLYMCTTAGTASGSTMPPNWSVANQTSYTTPTPSVIRYTATSSPYTITCLNLSTNITSANGGPTGGVLNITLTSPFMFKKYCNVKLTGTSTSNGSYDGTYNVQSINGFTITLSYNGITTGDLTTNGTARIIGSTVPISSQSITNSNISGTTPPYANITVPDISHFTTQNSRLYTISGTTTNIKVSVAITTIVINTGVATITPVAGKGTYFVVGNKVTLANTNGIDGTYTITSVTPAGVAPTTSFTVSVTGTSASVNTSPAPSTTLSIQSYDGIYPITYVSPQLSTITIPTCALGNITDGQIDVLGMVPSYSNNDTFIMDADGNNTYYYHKSAVTGIKSLICKGGRILSDNYSTQPSFGLSGTDPSCVTIFSNVIFKETTVLPLGTLGYGPLPLLPNIGTYNYTSFYTGCTWSDISGYSNNLVNVNSALAMATGKNAIPSVLFDGVYNLYMINSSSLQITTNDFSIFGVFYVSSGNYSLLSKAGIQLNILNTSGSLYTVLNYDSKSITSQSISPGWHIISGVVNRSLGISYINIDGLTSSTSSDVSTNDLTNTSVWTMGNGFSGNIGEAIIFTNTITRSQCQLIEGYLAWKWGFILPSSHAYYSIMP